MQSANPSPSSSSRICVPLVFTAGFRFYFLAAGLFSVLAMGFWVFWLAIHAAGGAFVSLPFAVAPHLWHAHEMVFGYAVAVMAGFFVTAVPNWTGTREPGPGFVLPSAVVWMLGRFVVGSSAFFDPLLVAVVDLAFVPMLSVGIFSRLAKRTQLRNVVFLGLLTALLIGNLLVHLEWLGWTDDTASDGLRLGIFVTAAMIAIIGGRVVPAFTRNALQRQGHEGALPMSRPVLDRAGILLTVVAALTSVLPLPPLVFGVACLAAGGATLGRLAGWQGLATLGAPILWVLHGAFLLLGVGYLLVGVSQVFGGIGEISALHMLGVGAIGTMTLAMMTRASLGHTGRPLKVSGPIAMAYAAVIAAGVTRTFGTLVFDYFPVMLLSGAFWIAAFGLFVGVYAPILTAPRASR